MVISKVLLLLVKGNIRGIIMTNKVTMYQITKELLEEDGYGEVEPALIRDANPNNCKFLIKVLNAVGIDENLFKEDNGYVFSEQSKEAVKHIIKNHSAYAKVMKFHPNERDIETLTELVEQIQVILKYGIKDEEKRQQQLAKLEVITLHNRKNIVDYLNQLVVPSFEYTLNYSDNEILLLYYMEEMFKVKNKVENIREIMSEIRQEEIYTNSVEELNSLSAEEIIDHMNPFAQKVQLDRLVIKDILDTKNKKNEYIQDSIKELAIQLNITEKALIEELKKFRKLNYENHSLFKLREDTDLKGEYLPPYEVLKQAETEYNSKLNEVPKKIHIPKEAEDVMERILKERGLLE